MESELLVDIGVSVLLRVVGKQAERKKWARALAKLFVAIQEAAKHDPFLNAHIKEKQR